MRRTRQNNPMKKGNEVKVVILSTGEPRLVTKASCDEWTKGTSEWRGRHKQCSHQKTQQVEESRYRN